MLDAKLTILELDSETDLTRNVTFGWLPFHETWGEVELKTARNIFSSVAMGARTVEIKLRKQPLTLDNVILRSDRYLYITEINDTEDRHFMTVTTAQLDPVICTAKKETFTKNALNRIVSSGVKTLTFPAWLTEKYVGRTQADPQVVLDTMYVLITPKAIELDAGELVMVGGKTYAVWAAHTLDEHKNEYEIARKDEA